MGLGGSDGKEYACNAGDLGSIPGLERLPGERNSYTLQCSYQKNSMDRGAYPLSNMKEPQILSLSCGWLVLLTCQFEVMTLSSSGLWVPSICFKQGGFGLDRHVSTLTDHRNYPGSFTNMQMPRPQSGSELTGVRVVLRHQYRDWQKFV